MKHYFQTNRSRLAQWSWWIALFSMQLLLVTIALHRLGAVGTAATLNLVSAALFGGALALLTGLAGFVNIWFRGLAGGGNALAGVLTALVMFAVPMWNIPKLLSLPQINDISTDLDAPPGFRKLAAVRKQFGRNVAHPGGRVSLLQADAYPGVGPLMLERSTADVFNLVREASTELGWKIVNQSAPKKGSRPGWLEAVDRSLIIGFPDDIIVRITGDGARARIDMRSSSRFGRHDLGRNAARVAALFQRVKTKLAVAEAQRAEQAARTQLIARLKLKKLAKLRLQEQREREARALESDQEDPAKPLPYGLRTTFGPQGPAAAATGVREAIARKAAQNKEKTRRRARKKRRSTFNPFANTFFNN